MTISLSCGERTSQSPGIARYVAPSRDTRATAPSSLPRSTKTRTPRGRRSLVIAAASDRSTWMARHSRTYESGFGSTATTCPMTQTLLGILEHLRQFSIDLDVNQPVKVSLHHGVVLIRVDSVLDDLTRQPLHYVTGSRLSHSRLMLARAFGCCIERNCSVW